MILLYMDKIPESYAKKYINNALPSSLRYEQIIMNLYKKLDNNHHLQYNKITETYFFDQYVKYYVEGLTDEKDFEDIICDTAFHFTDLEKSKSFFLEVYLDNKFLQRKFKNHFNLDASSDLNKYKSWMVENFNKYYQKYHKDVL